MVTTYDPYNRPDETGFFTGDPSANFNNLQPTDILTKTFYDDQSNLTSGFPNSPNTACNATAAIGKVVGTKVKILESTDEWIYTRTCYDEYGRSIGTNSDNHLGGNDEVISYLNLADLPTGINRIHNTPFDNKAITDNFTYDNFLRQTIHRHGIGDDLSNVSTQLLSSSLYNNLDQLTHKRLGGSTGGNALGFLQDINYKYNSRGWLTHINDVETSVPGEEAIPACNDIPFDCEPECDFHLNVSYGGKNAIYDLTIVRNAIPKSVPLNYPYWIGTNYSNSITELNRFKTDVMNWMSQQGLPIQNVNFIDKGSHIRIKFKKAKANFYSIFTLNEGEITFTKTNCLLSVPDDVPPIVGDFQEINPIKLRIEYDHNALTGDVINPSLIRITETARYVRHDNLSFIEDRTMVRPVREEATFGQPGDIVGWDGNSSFTSNMSYVMDIDLEGLGINGSDFGTYTTEVEDIIATEINNAGINSSGAEALQSTILHATVEGWDGDIHISSGSPYYVINNPDLFALQLVYDDTHDMVDATPQQNGNIAGMIWKTAGRTKQSYSFQYDDINRLIGGFHQEDTGEPDYVANNYNVDITYDNVGNIKTLNRNGVIDNGVCPGQPNTGFTFGEIDKLTYNYSGNGNRLTSIDELSDKTKGYKSKITGNNAAYGYDFNGNVIRDDSKGIIIEYNHLNLPKEINFTGTSNRIVFTYDAAGIKLKKEVSGDENYILHYIGGIEYRQDTNSSPEPNPTKIESIHHAEGRVFFDKSKAAPNYEYHLKDHLGNVRVVFADKDGDGYIEPFNTNPNDLTSGNNGDIVVNLLETDVLQETHYYPFGMEMEGNWQNIVNTPENHYLYNGKELNTDFDLNWSDYGARWYDASIGRWNAIDPLAEVYDNLSPYHYAVNNPASNFDPNGMNSQSTSDLIQNAWEATPENGSATFDGEGNCNCGCPNKPPCETGTKPPKLPKLSDYDNDPWAFSGAGYAMSYGMNSYQRYAFENGLNGLTKAEMGIVDEAKREGFVLVGTTVMGGKVVSVVMNKAGQMFVWLARGSSITKTALNIGGRSSKEWAKLFQWGKKADGALDKIDNLSMSDIQRLKDAGVKMKDVKEWSKFYKKAINKKPNSPNQAAKARSKLMDSIINLW